MEIRLGTTSDIEQWMVLVRQVKDLFPGLETTEALHEHRSTVLDFMERSSAICACDGQRIVGALLFSKKENMICFLAVDEAYRRQHIAEQMVSYMLMFLDAEKDVIVMTYRKEAPQGTAARFFYKRLGFVEGRLTEEFGAPVQEFVLKRSIHRKNPVE